MEKNMEKRWKHEKMMFLAHFFFGSVTIQSASAVLTHSAAVTMEAQNPDAAVVTEGAPLETKATGTEPREAFLFMRPAKSGVVLFGMSPRNGHYNRKNITRRLQYILSTLSEGWTVRPLVPQAPSIWTYLALGYTKDRAIRSAREIWRKLFRFAREAAAGDVRYQDCEWDDLTGGATNPSYVAALKRIETAYETNDAFRRDVQEASRGLLKRDGKATEEAVAIACRYLLEEFAGLSVLRKVVGAQEVVLVYHKEFVPLDRLLEGSPYGLPALPNISTAVVNVQY
ncbi:hypothetical protein BSKO_11118 [Bryopsis sp. KO-2023]|nr:hypothetical protein BSKO_11118 [Bryopsis sp. KO-2023]